MGKKERYLGFLDVG